MSPSGYRLPARADPTEGFDKLSPNGMGPSPNGMGFSRNG
jgi:hypothetical protein